MPMQTWLNALFSSLDCEGKKPHRLTSTPFASSLRCAVPFLSSAFLAANLANLPAPAAQSPVSHVVWPLESGIGRGHCPGALLACWAASRPVHLCQCQPFALQRNGQTKMNWNGNENENIGFGQPKSQQRHGWHWHGRRQAKGEAN
jgi:hypothetical protein